MAGTIIATPAIGASSWADFIVQQGATDTGYMRVSLTNFSGTAASNVATGSVMECAGSIYSFTDTSITLETGTASASVAIYYVAVPSTDTTVSIYMEGTAPTWVDAKQGFYQSAASLTRYIGGAYIGTAETYYTKFLYTGENLIYCLQTGETRPLLKKTFNIGEWDMDTTTVVPLAHGISDPDKIRTMRAIVKGDPGGNFATGKYNLDAPYTAGSAAGSISIYNIDSSQIAVARRSGAFFDNADFDGTAGTIENRGWVFIEYET